MANTTSARIKSGLIFLFFVIFPFGQILRMDIPWMGSFVTIHPIDLVAFASTLFWWQSKGRQPEISRYILNFLQFAFFSYLLSIFYFYPSNLLVFGAFYLIRLVIYFYFFLFVFGWVRENKDRLPLLTNALISTGVITAILGWLQYFLYPDLTGLFAWGWDDHLFRLTGTFLDPGFTSIILVLGFLIILSKFLNEKKILYIFLLGFMLISLAFTYSRAGMLALVAGTFILVGLRNWKTLVAGLLIFAALIFILPRPAGEGVRLERLSSVFPRIENYQQTISVWSKYPLFGVGYNNICLAKRGFPAADPRIPDHACSGSDSSLLLVLATTGVLGFFALLQLLTSLFLLKGGHLTVAAKSSIGALLVHSLFVNSLFYPWVLGWMGVLLSVALQEVKEKN